MFSQVGSEEIRKCRGEKKLHKAVRGLTRLLKFPMVLTKRKDLWVVSKHVLNVKFYWRQHILKIYVHATFNDQAS